MSVGPTHIEQDRDSKLEEDIELAQAPPPQYPKSSDSATSSSSPPPAFSSLYTSTAAVVEAYKTAVTEAGAPSVPAYAPSASVALDQTTPGPNTTAVSETKAAPLEHSRNDKSKNREDNEPPPAYDEGSSPLDSFTYTMAATGGPASIITQVSQGGAPPMNTLGGMQSSPWLIFLLHTDLHRCWRRREHCHGPEVYAEDILCDYATNDEDRGTRFTLSRDELLTLPEFVLLSLFPNGLLPDGHLNGFHESDAFQVDVRTVSYTCNILRNLDVYIADVTSQYDPASLRYMLEFFRDVAQTIPSGSESPSADSEAIPIEPMAGSAREMLQDRAGIIVLREDLDFYVIPPRADIEQPEMIEVKRAAAKTLLKQGGIFSGLRRSDEPGTTEQHLIEMLTAGCVPLHRALPCQRH